MILERQELTAILILVLVILILGVASVVLDGSRGSFAGAYCETLPDKTLVCHTGVIDSITDTKTGGHQILNVSGITVFLPGTVAEKTWFSKGDTIELTGEMATYQGKREIMISDSDIITIV